MFIELAGADGSGKSTILQRIRRHLLDSGVPTWERHLRSAAKLVFADLAHQRGCGHWSEYFSPEEVEMAHAVEMVSAYRQQVAPIDLRRQAVLTDTFMWRWLATAAMWESSNLDRLVTLFQTIPPPSLSIRLTVDTDVAHRRLLARPQGDSLLKMGDKSKLDRYARAFEAVAPLIPYPTLVVDANLPLGDILPSVLAAVDEVRGL